MTPKATCASLRIMAPMMSLGGLIPRGIGRVLYQVAIEVRGAVRPPHEAAFAECKLDGVDRSARLRQSLVVFVMECDADFTPCGHQGVDEFGSGFFAQCRVRSAPQTMANDQVAAIRGEECRQRSLARRTLAHHCRVGVAIASKDEARVSEAHPGNMEYPCNALRVHFACPGYAG